MDHDIENNTDEIELNSIKSLLPRYRGMKAVAYKRVRSVNPLRRNEPPKILKTKLGSVDLPTGSSIEDADAAVRAQYPQADAVSLYDETGTLISGGSILAPQSESSPRSYRMDNSLKAEVDAILEDGGDSKGGVVSLNFTGTAANMMRDFKKVAGAMMKKKPAGGGGGFGKPKGDEPIVDVIDEMPPGDGEIVDELDDDGPPAPPMKKGPPGGKMGKMPPLRPVESVQLRARGIVNRLIEGKKPVQSR